MIVAEGLTKQFDGFLAVDNVNLNVPIGQVLVLLGPNGAGKTTTVRMLTSLLLPSKGRASVAGYDVVLDAEKVRSLVGVLTEQHGLYGRMNAVEYLKFFGSLYGLKRQVCQLRIDRLLEDFGLSIARRQRLGEYSKGMRQKLAMVRALLHDPPVLLFDEPTSAMDPESARMVRDSILTLRSKDRAIVLCTHNLIEAEELADQIAIIHQGKIILNETPANIKRKLLGPVEYEIRLTHGGNSYSGKLPRGVSLINHRDNILSFRIDNPEETNPLLLRQLLAEQLDVISFQELPRSLEKAYLEAVNRAKKEATNA